MKSKDWAHTWGLVFIALALVVIFFFDTPPIVYVGGVFAAAALVLSIIHVAQSHGNSRN